MDDAQLAQAARTGDRSAYAAIYDRHADRIHDFGASMLRNRAEAADALQEVFLVAYESLARLQEPARLRAWLYALAHRSILDRTEEYGPEYFANDRLDLGTGAAEQPLSRAELAEFVWQAASGLDLADRVLLDLHLRQGLEGRDLAGAAGVAAPQLDARVSRLEAQIDRALGALVVARTGRRSCPDLFPILERGGRQATATLRHEITGHVDECERCNSRRRIASSPLSLLAATALTPAPAYLRGVVLGKAELSDMERNSDVDRDGLSSRAGWAFQRDGFPVLAEGTGATPVGGDRSTGPVFASIRPTQPTSVLAAAAQSAPTTYLPPRAPIPPEHRYEPPRWGILVGALAGLIVLITAALVISNHGKGSNHAVGVTSSTTSAEATTVVSDTTTITTRPAVIPSTSVVPTTVSTAAGHLIVGAKTLDLGTGATTASIQLGNDGGTTFDFTTLATGTGLTVNPVAGAVAPSASQTLTVKLDRSANPAGAFTGSVLISSPAGNTTIPVTGIIDTGPQISGESAAPSTISVSGCVGKPTTTVGIVSTITATVNSTQPVQTVVLHSAYTTASGTTQATSPMTMSGTVYSGTLPRFGTSYAVAGTVDWWITAIDTATVTGTSLHHTISVVAC